ncbi:CsgG/HfaB family protein [Xanthovirga aplysinae]|uniref:CsgG/HfaB family protein n=1 Tax=Xanthovirga aplysinae TaxID=2529853 RepID=UPI0012BC23F6|nr:CsgG/HfaB family protein [Xanthovirga aplysinae]MTI30729.1 curli production assembly/transport component CsgG [Xanthovirga aplysinae]
MFKLSGLKFTNLFGLVFLILFGSCVSSLYKPMNTVGARLGTETPVHSTFMNLPEPKEKIVVAVYNFRDQTGQYKPSEMGASWSTAVTQGGTSILLRALESSNWFIPIEREGLSNLLNERKIIRSNAANYPEYQQLNINELLPPLLYAGVILEGGIISYDSNIRTGGAGLRYFGSGGSGQYREDIVTIYLRVISTRSGQVLKTIYTSKKILSQKLDAGLFKFVDDLTLAEAETGFTYNEPSSLAVSEAIEKAVYSLVVEGIMDDLWVPAVEEEKEGFAVQQYLHEKDRNANMGIMGKEPAKSRGKIGISFSTGASIYAGDYADPNVEMLEEFALKFPGDGRIGIGINVGQLNLSTVEQAFHERYSYAELNVNYRAFPKFKYTPLITAGYGFINSDIEDLNNFKENSIPKIHAKVGFEYLLNRFLGLEVTAGYNYLFSDELDGTINGTYNDYYWTGNIGLNFWVFGGNRSAKRSSPFSRRYYREKAKALRYEKAFSAEVKTDSLTNGNETSISEPGKLTRKEERLLQRERKRQNKLGLQKDSVPEKVLGSPESKEADKELSSNPLKEVELSKKEKRKLRRQNRNAPNSAAIGNDSVIGKATVSTEAQELNDRNEENTDQGLTLSKKERRKLNRLEKKNKKKSQER